MLRKTAKRLGHYGRLLLYVAAVVLVLACNEPAAGGPPPQPPLAPAPSSSSAATRPCEDVYASLDDLRLQLEQARASRDSYKAAYESHKSGLDAAIAELNRLGQANRLAQVQPAPAAPPATAPQARAWGSWPARVSTLGAPQVQVSAFDILVTGTLWNSGDEEAKITAKVTLLVDNKPINSKSFPMTVPARSEAAYSQSFYFPGNTGTYSATVSF